MFVFETENNETFQMPFRTQISEKKTNFALNLKNMDGKVAERIIVHIGEENHQNFFLNIILSSEQLNKFP